MRPGDLPGLSYFHRGRQHLTGTIPLTGHDLGSASDSGRNVRCGFAGTTQNKRQDFGLTWNQALETGEYPSDAQLEFGLEMVAM